MWNWQQQLFTASGLLHPPQFSWVSFMRSMLLFSSVSAAARSLWFQLRGITQPTDLKKSPASLSLLWQKQRASAAGGPWGKENYRKWQRARLSLRTLALMLQHLGRGRGEHAERVPLSVDNTVFASIPALALVQSDSAWFTMSWSWADATGPSAPTVTPDMRLNRPWNVWFLSQHKGAGLPDWHLWPIQRT